MAPAEPLLDWIDAAEELLGFLAAFAASGAIGFRFAVLRGLTGAHSRGDERQLAARLAGRVAWLGAAGAWISAGFFALETQSFAAERHLTIPALVASMPAIQIQITCLLLAAIGFVMAARRSDLGWLLAALGVCVAPLRGLVTGQVLRLVNPVHEFAAGLWIGTLFCLAVFALPAIWRSAWTSDQRGAAAAAVVRAFSPLAQGAVAVLVVCGVITAWRHLHGLHNLWSTPYGYALLVKLALVAAVLGLGWINWKKHTPRLGSEETGLVLWRSARIELSLAGFVLLVTAILVSLPSPEAPGQ